MPESVAERNYKHGLSRETLYIVHQGMMARCYKKHVKAYKDYGARGISVFEEWHDVEEFIAWVEANLGPRPDGMSLDRIDNDGGYEPGNIRWATATEQVHNQRPRAAGVEQRARIRRYLLEHPGVAAGAIADALEISERTVGKHLKAMERDGDVEALRAPRSSNDLRLLTWWRATALASAGKEETTVEAAC